jgi:hypothetical protein
MIFLRFVENTNNKIRPGIFKFAYELIESEPSLKFEFLGEILIWFTKNLTPPDKFHKSGKEGICWYKNSSKLFISRMYELCYLLETFGLEWKCLSTHNPGKIIFQDQHQIVAIPYKETFT